MSPLLSLVFGDGSEGARCEFYGPQFIVNPHGQPLDLFALNKVISRPFNGGAHQQWTLVDDGTGTKFALKSEHSCLFVGMSKYAQGARLVAKVEPFYWAISESGGSYKLSTPDSGLALSLGESANLLLSTEKGTELLILENTRKNREAIVKFEGQIVPAAQSANNPPSSIIPPPVASVSCSAIYRRFGISTQQLTLAPPSSVGTLPYGILLMRSASGEQNDVQAGIILQLVATLRNSVCHMPPVFYRRAGSGFWDDLTPVFRPIDNGWTFAFTLMGLIDLAAVIPGPATIDFTSIPTEQAEVVGSNGENIDIAQWEGGTRCIASYCLQIIRALPEHSPQYCM